MLKHTTWQGIIVLLEALASQPNISRLHHLDGIYSEGKNTEQGLRSGEWSQWVTWRMHGSRLLDVGRGKHKRLNGKQKYNPNDGFVKRSAAR